MCTKLSEFSLWPDRLSKKIGNKGACGKIATMATSTIYAIMVLQDLPNKLQQLQFRVGCEFGLVFHNDHNPENKKWKNFGFVFLFSLEYPNMWKTFHLLPLFEPSEMKTNWHKSRSEKMVVSCPVCGHKTTPPDYPYCFHTLFVYVDPSADDAFFDFMRDDFAAAWKNRKARIPNKKSIDSLDIATSCEVWDVSESSSYYPTRVVAGYEITMHELEPTSPADG